MSNRSRRAYHGGTSDSISIMTRRHCIRVAREPGKRALVSIVAARLLLVIESVVVCGHVLSVSVVIFCVCAHYLDRGLWSCPGGFFRHVLGLRSSLGSVFISWIVGCGHVPDGSLVISWVCDHFLACGLWSYLGWVCGHLLAP